MTIAFGPTPSDRGTTFQVWAPAHDSVSLVFDSREIAMARNAEGFFSVDVPHAGAGQRYWYRLPQGLRPDPASRWQPEGPLGPSEVVDTRGFRWTDSGWAGAGAAHRHVIYEMHIGTFTREGTWAAAVAHLPSLAEVGITTIEVMPIAEFPGRFGWGYDGAQLFAPTHQYGTPDDVRRFVDAAHARGLAVILDVVYNHFGPVGNFLPEFSRSVIGKPGEWGHTINYDGEGSGPVREFMKQNAAYWIREFHFDGLRMDAINAIEDSSSEHIVSEICHAAREAAGNRAVFIAGECESQDSRLLQASGVYQDGLDAMWNEDWHHAAMVALTGRRQAYMTDYRGQAHEFASMARHGFLYQGQWYSWQKRERGSFAIGLPSRCFVSFLENHDQVANTGPGGRLHEAVDAARWRAMTALLLLGPALPLLFQGQEFGSTRPFNYFADHQGELGAAVENGRFEFLSQFPTLRTPEARAGIPKPGELATFERSKLSDDERHRDSPLRRLHRDLLRLRRDDVVLRDVGTPAVRIESSAPAPGVVLLRYFTDTQHRLLVVNFADDYRSPMNDPLLAPLGSTKWTQLWSSEQVQYGGCGVASVPDVNPWIIPGGSACVLASWL
jgi:maltooligosyltrehalose trehalohydrolase